MLPTPWRYLRSSEGDREYLALLTFLPLKRLWRAPWLLMQALRVIRQLEHSPGLVAYSLSTELSKGHFWTLSVWEGEPALQAFVHAAPHANTMRSLAPHMGQTRFVRWVIRGSQLPVAWDEALAR